jgi:hypothetical protein
MMTGGRPRKTPRHPFLGTLAQEPIPPGSILPLAPILHLSLLRNRLCSLCVPGSAGLQSLGISLFVGPSSYTWRMLGLDCIFPEFRT